jgi:membrane protein implicated in regulation of membrane protease activity
LALSAAELHTGALYSLFLGIGAMAAGLAALAHLALPLQAVVGLTVAVLGIVYARPRLVKLNRRSADPGLGELVGQVGTTLDLVQTDPERGHVKLAGETWLAVSQIAPIEAGVPVMVTSVRGTTLVVCPNQLS